MSLKYDVDFHMGKIDGLLKDLETEVTKSIGKGVAQGMQNSQKNATKRGAAIGADMKKGVIGGLGDMGVSNASSNAAAKSKGAANDAGATIGKNISFAALGTLSASLGAGITNILGNVVGRSIGLGVERQKSEIALGQTVAIVEKRNASLQKTLGKSNASIQERAIALGVDTEKLYKNATATASATSAGSGLEKSINAQKDALDDLIFAKEQDIFSAEQQLDNLRKENEARLKLERTKRGADALESGNKELDIQITALKLRENELEVNGLSTAAIKLELEELNRKKETNDLLLDQIDQQTDGIKKEGETLETELLSRIERLRAEITASKNQFDIDIRPAEKKLERLQELASGVSSGGSSGSSQVIDPQAEKYIAQIEAEKKNGGDSTFTLDEVTSVVDQLASKDAFGSVISRTSINKLITDLVLGQSVKGGDTDTLAKLASNLIDTASVNKSANISLDQAIGNLGFAVRTGQSQIGNQSGLPENFATEIDPLGLTLLEKELTVAGELEKAERVRNGFVTESELAYARTLGVLNRTEDTAGGFAKVQKEGAFAIEEAKRSWEEMYTVIGLSILPAIKPILEIVGKIVTKLTEFISENPELVQFLLLAAGIFGTILTTVGLIVAGVGVVAAIAAGLGIAFGPALLVIGGILAGVVIVSGYIAGMGLLLANLYQNNPFFREIVGFLKDKVIGGFRELSELIGLVLNGDFAAATDKLIDIWNKTIEAVVSIVSDPRTWELAFGVILTVLDTIFFKIPSLLAKIIRETDWGKIFEGLYKGMDAAIKGATKAGFNGIISKITGDDPASSFLRDNLQNIVDSFQSGASFMVPQQFRNDRLPINVSAGEKVTVTPQSQTYATTNIYGLTPEREFHAAAFL